MATLSKQLENAKARRQLNEEKLKAAVAGRKTEILQKFDFIDTTLRGKRRRVNIERGRNQETSWMHNRNDYLQGYSSARDSVRNNDLSKSFINQFAFNVIGKYGGKAHFKTDSTTFNESAQNYIWKTWGRNCDGTGQSHFNIKLKQMLASALTDGGVINVFDDFSSEADGMLYTYTFDWVTPVNNPPALPDWLDTYQHKDGWLFNSKGKIIGCCIGQERSSGNKDAEEVQAYYFGKSAWMWSPFLCAPLLDWQVGVSALSPSWLNIEGLKEMRSKELDTAGIAAALLMQVLTEESAEAAAWAASGGDPDEIVNLEDIEESDTPDTEAKARDNWEEFEQLRGGRIHYNDDGERAEILDAKRPNLDTETYYKDVSRAAGASVGFGDAYTQMKADRSYTAFRGEMLMTWRGVFENLQKEIERDICDRVVELAINWGIKQGEITGAPEGWENKIMYQWPIMPEVDPAKWMTAIGQEFGYGLATPAKYLGPDGDEIAKNNRRVNDDILRRNNGESNNEQD